MLLTTTALAAAMLLSGSGSSDDYRDYYLENYAEDDPCNWMRTSGEWTVYFELMRSVPDPVRGTQLYIHNPTRLTVLGSALAGEAPEVELDILNDRLNQPDALAILDAAPSRWDNESNTTHYQGQLRMSLTDAAGASRWIARGELTREELDELGSFWFEMVPDEQSGTIQDLMRALMATPQDGYAFQFSFTPDQGQPWIALRETISSAGLGPFFGPEATESPFIAMQACPLNEEFTR
ncbi:hypothetical protein [Maricaulis sp.]|uniref:hypothetical protein n=1 Tax=Maricaulis sp. TaxID=1486257 RepID=UPI00260D4E37|nr:hypothetical protein [Maricaulis sp.]